MKTFKIIIATLMMGLLLNATPTTSAAACGTHKTKAKTTSIRTSHKKTSMHTSAMRTTLSTPQGIGFNGNAGVNVGTLGVNGNIGAGVNSSGLNSDVGISTTLGGLNIGTNLGSNLGVNAGVNTPLGGLNAGIGTRGMSFATSNGVGFSVPQNELGWRHVTPFWDLPVRLDTTGESSDWSYLNRPDFYSYGTTGPMLQGNVYVGSPNGITPMTSTTITVPNDTRMTLTQRVGNGINNVGNGISHGITRTYHGISNQLKRSTYELTHGGRTH